MVVTHKKKNLVRLAFLELEPSTVGPCAVQNAQIKSVCHTIFSGFCMEEKVLDSPVIESLVAGKASYANEASSFFCSLSSLNLHNQQKRKRKEIH